MLTFERLIAVDVVDGNVALALLATDGKRYDFSLSPAAVGLVVAAIQTVSTRLPEYQGPAVVPVGMQAAIGPDVEPALLIDLGGNLTIGISLPPEKLAALNAAIAQVEQASKPVGGTH